MYDVVIVGGRCAGAPLAMLLAQAGHKVLVVDRATFPSDTMSTHFIQSPGMVRLAQWGLMDALFATNCPPVTQALFDVDGVEMEFPVPLMDPLIGLASPRRHVLDKLLIDAAVDAGAELAEGISVHSLITEDDRVVGIKGTGAGAEFEARARFVIGADGRHSFVAEKVGAEMTRHVEPITGGYYSYFAGTGNKDRTQVFFHEGVVCVMFPTNDDLVTVAIAWPKARFPEIRSDIEGNFNNALASFGEHGQKILDGERAGRFTGAADLTNYLRRTHGPGWALVGDACYHKDPTPADGISDAFRGAEMLAGALGSILEEGADEQDALATYDAGYQAVADKHFEPALRSARFDITSQERSGAFFESRLYDQEEIEALLSTSNGGDAGE